MSGLPLTIRDGGRVPSKKSTTAPQTSDNTRSPASSVEPPMCGVHSTFGSLSTAKCGHQIQKIISTQALSDRVTHAQSPSFNGAEKAHQSTSLTAAFAGVHKRYRQTKFGGLASAPERNTIHVTFTCTSRQLDLQSECSRSRTHQGLRHPTVPPSRHAVALRMRACE